MLRKLYTASSAASSASINNLLHSFEASFKSARLAAKNAGYGRRYQLTRPTPNSNPQCRALLEALKAHESDLNEGNYTRALLLLGSEGHLEACRSLFQAGVKRFPLSADLYSALIYGIARSHGGSFEEAEGVFRRAVKQAGLHPTRQLYESLIEAFCAHVERSLLTVGEAATDAPFLNMSIPLKIYRKMISSGHEPRISGLTSLLKVAGRLKDPTAVELLRRDRERFALPADDQFREALLFALLQCGLVGEAEACLPEAMSATSDPQRLLNVMLHGYARLDALLPARHLLLQQHALHGVRPGPGVACLLVECAARLGQVREARLWLAEATVGGSSELKWRAGGALMRAYLRAGDYEQFYQLFNELRCEEPIPEEVWALLVVALEASPDPLRLHTQISTLFRDRLQLSHPPAQHALFRMLFLAGAGEELIRRLLGQMPQLPQQNPSLLMWILGRLGDYHGCLEVMTGIMTQEKEKDMTGDWSSLMMAAAGSGDVACIHDVLSRMHRQRAWISPEVRLWAMRGFYAGGRAEDVNTHWELLQAGRLPAKLFAQALSLQVKSLLGLQGDREAAYRLLCAHEGGWDSECLQLFLALSRQGGQDPGELLRLLKESEVVGRLKRMGRGLTGACNEVIAAAVVTGDTATVQQVLAWMRENSRFGDEQTVKLLLSLSEGLKMSEEVLSAYQAAGRLPSLRLLKQVVTALLSASKQPGDPSNVRAESLSEWAVSSGLAIGDHAAFKELLLVWRGYFSRHGRADRVAQLDEILNKSVK